MNLIEELCRYLEAHASEGVTLEGLAARARMSPFHLQRRFREVVGLSPKQYQEAQRMKRLRAGLRRERDVTQAIFEAGFGSLSRVYERADGQLGMTPREYRKGGAGVEISFVTLETPLGLMLAAATDRGLCALLFGESEEELARGLRKEFPEAQVEPGRRPYGREIEEWRQALNGYLAGAGPCPDLPLDIRATAFQALVWRYLRTIPGGTTQSYGAVAEGIGRPTSARAVARACAANRVALLIPCHRVIRGSGNLGGYRWGLERKRALLEQEAAGPRRG